MRLIAVVIFCLSSSLFAQTVMHGPTMRDHLRLSLWYEGMKTEDQKKPEKKSSKKLPVEIEKVLINF